MPVKTRRLRPETLSLATKAIHGRKTYPFQGPLTTPIYQTSTYRFEDSKIPLRYAHGDPSVYVYSRYHNPTVREVEERLALMEGAEEAALFSSGMAAITTTILALTRSNEEIVSTPALYGGTYRFFRDELPKHRIKVKFVDPHRLEQLERLITPKTRIVYFETPTNPTLDVIDIREVVERTTKTKKKFGQPLITMLDNTFATVLNQNPFKLGVDTVVESATKYLGGHSDLLAGAVLGNADFIKKVKDRAKSHGGCADPFAAYLLLRSLATFELRIQRQNESAFKLAQELEKHPKVNRVIYPGLPSHPYHHLATRQMKKFGGIVTIEVKGGVKAAAKVCDSLNVAVNAMSLGGVETLVSIPVYSSHINMTKRELQRHGVTPGMIRISVGVEGIEDLLADFEQALKKA
jgi:cystathionine beta-lyase/cystathionine gamma-synthase